MKVLFFTCRGEYYKVKENGDLLQVSNTYNEWNESWKLYGVSLHWNRNDIDLSVKEIFANPSKMIGGYVWDIDHGTLRAWRGRYCGGLPRVTNAYIKEVQND